MIIYVIHEQKLFNMTLPLKINGSYSLTDIFNNKEILPLYNLYKMNTYKKVAKIENRLNNIRFFFNKEVIIP